jgi:DNA repair exonuclease SbcCD nuclease subunit
VNYLKRKLNQELFYIALIVKAYLANYYKIKLCGGTVTKNKPRVDAILVADIHARTDTPICRTDNFWEAQAIKLAFLNELQIEHQCPILVSGDIFDVWKPDNPFLLNWAIENFPNNMICIPGQHDLPEHSMEQIKKSSFYNLHTSKKITWINKGPHHLKNAPNLNLYGIPWGFDFTKRVLSLLEDNVSCVALIHILTVPNMSNAFPGAIGSVNLMKKLHQFKLIVTGDNHQAFFVKTGDQLLVNPGSFMRTSADQADYKPRVYLWNAQENTVKPVFLPITPGVVDRSHIDKKESKNAFMEAYIEHVKVSQEGKGEFSSFEDSLESHFNVNNPKNSVKQAVYKAMKKREK